MRTTRLTIDLLRCQIELQRSRRNPAQRDQRGEAVGWLLIIIGVIAIAGIVVLAVTTYVTSQTGKLDD